MRRRRAFLAGVTGTLPLAAAGCVSAPGATDSTSCPETTTTGGNLVFDNDPARAWRLGERIEDPEPFYRPRVVNVANFDVEREISVTISRDDADSPVLERTITFDVEEYVRLWLLEPDVWTVEIALPDGPSKTHTVTDFDCNGYNYGVSVRCDGRFTVFGGVSLSPCEDYPVNESGNGSASEPPATTAAARS